MTTPVRLFDERAVRLLEAAILAPSSHNTQPWLFRVEDGAIELYADRTRALPVNDPEDRELVISCGTALFNLRVAAAHEGLVPAVTLFPNRNDIDLLAKVDLPAGDATFADEATLFPAIATRRTYRKRFAARAVPAEVVELLVAAAETEGAWLAPLASEAARHEVAELVAQGDALQWANPSWRRELAAWMHPRRKGDGIPISGLTAPLSHFIVRRFDMGQGVGAKDQQLAEGSPLLAVLGTAGDGQGDWLRAGQALERVLLLACQHGLQASYLNQPIEVAGLRPRIQQLAGHPGAPQALLRFGYPEETVEASPRRPLEEMLD